MVSIEVCHCRYYTVQDHQISFHVSQSNGQDTLQILHTQDVLGEKTPLKKKTCLSNIICKCPCTLEVDECEESIAGGRCGM